MPQCLYPKIIHDAPVQCGKCMYCRNKRISGWAARLMNHDFFSDMSFFITLTYDPDHLMFCPNNRPTLWPSHLTNYWKILRKNFPSGSLSYYACGEYGSNKKRPHYHAILFIQDQKVTPMDALKYIEKSWSHGSVYVGTVTQESCAYVLKYLEKKGSVPQYSGDTRAQEFQRVSKGIGKNYLTPNMIAWHQAKLTERAYIPLNRDNRAPLPRYYKDKIYTKEQKAIIGQYMEQTLEMRDHQTLMELRKINTIKLNA